MLTTNLKNTTAAQNCLSSSFNNSVPTSCCVLYSILDCSSSIKFDTIASNTQAASLNKEYGIDNVTSTPVELLNKDYVEMRTLHQQ